MKAYYPPISGLIEVTPKVIPDDRGIFFESYHYKKLKELGIKDNFVQDNQSFSKKGVLRGIHFQKSPSQQSKLIRVIVGQALDVAVDLRPNSPTFGQHYSTVLSAEAHNMLYIPEGFGHGFIALEDTVLLYKCNDYYDKASEGGLLWNDPALGIDWKVNAPLLSEKDKELPTLAELKKSL